MTKTHQLNHEELSLLIRDNLWPDLTVEPIEDYSLVSSDDAKIFARVITQQGDVVFIGKSTYDSILSNADIFGYSPAYIVGSPEGIFVFNLDMMKLNFEEFSDPDAGVSVQVAELALDRGTRVIEWYPDFPSEDEYIDTLMSDNPDSDFFLQEEIR